MKITLLLALAASLTLAAPAVAAPAPQPTTDFEADWVLDNDGSRMKLRYSVTKNMMRVEVDNTGGQATVLRNFATGLMHNWSPDMPGFVMRMQSTPENTREATPTGETLSFSGESCTVWRAERSDVCFTDDGIWVHSTGAGNNAHLENLVRTEQSPVLFEPPAGAEIMDMPTGMGAPGGGFSPF